MIEALCLREETRIVKEVLVIDDQVACSSLVEVVLEGEGCHVEVANGAEEALWAIRTKQYDLIVLDWNMPFADGGETLLLLEKALSKYRAKIPFVLYTGVDPQSIDLPHTRRFHLIDFWVKSGKPRAWFNQAKNLIKRLGR